LIATRTWTTPDIFSSRIEKHWGKNYFVSEVRWSLKPSLRLTVLSTD